jgi:hypothetical protein
MFCLCRYFQPLEAIGHPSGHRHVASAIYYAVFKVQGKQHWVFEVDCQTIGRTLGAG